MGLEESGTDLAGVGDDLITSADDQPGDVLDCGKGNDRYTADPGDEVTNCETDVSGQSCSPPPPGTPDA